MNFVIFRTKGAFILSESEKQKDTFSGKTEKQGKMSFPVKERSGNLKFSQEREFRIS